MVDFTYRKSKGVKMKLKEILLKRIANLKSRKYKRVYTIAMLEMRVANLKGE